MHGTYGFRERVRERFLDAMSLVKQSKRVRKMGEKAPILGGNSSFIVLFCFLSRALVNADKQYSNTFDITPIRSALIDTSCGTRTTETRAFLLHKKRYSRETN